ncbi:MAG: T9SS type A sorting domain-containing protein [Ignavibacteria bacterium]|nr:T9SS type A sorting domain-containing protein [Ignavibacteria bacterium]
MQCLFNTRSISTPQNLLTVLIKTFTIKVICLLILIFFTMSTYARSDISPLEKHLNPDGTINTSQGFSSSLDMKGWQMITDSKTKEPKFYRNTDDPNVITWENIGGTSSTNDGILTVVIDDSGNVYAGGCFTTIVGVSANYIAKWNGSTWSPLGSGVNDAVRTITVLGSDVYAGGDFTTAGGVSANYIARWNGSTWSPVGSGMNGVVYALADIGSDVYAGGYFTTAGGVSANNIARWNGSTWSPLGSGVDTLINAIAVLGSDVYAGGYFTIAGGVSANNIARWNGSTWSPLGSGVNDLIWSIAVFGSDVYAGGVFTTAGGVSANRIAKWNGSTWSPLGSGMNADVRTIAVLGSDVYAGGDFTTAGGVSANYIAKWNGSTWSPLGSGMNDVVLVLKINFPEGKMYVGGAFTTAGGITASRIVRFTDSETPFFPPSIPVLLSPANNSVGNPLALSLTWLKADYAVSYRVQVATDSLFSSLIINDSTVTDTTKTITGLNPLTTYYWRVNAKNVIGLSAYSSVWKFRTVGYPTQINLLYPPNDTTNIPVSVNFTWNKAIDQTDAMKTIAHKQADYRTISKYWFELTTDTTGPSLIIDSTLTDTTKLVSGLPNPITYYWRVKAKNEIGWGIFSSRFKFTTIVSAPLAPVLVSPVNGATLVATNPLLDWDNSVFAESYRIQVSTDSGFTGTVYDSSNITITEFQIHNNGLTINTTYYWRVNATNIAGTGPFSIIFHFTTGATNISGKNEIPEEFRLYNNYPNPFNPTTKIKFDIPKHSYIKLIVYDVLGREIMTLINEKLGAGKYEVNWTASGYPSGVYFFRLITNDFSSTKKLILLK